MQRSENDSDIENWNIRDLENELVVSRFVKERWKASQKVSAST